VSAPPATTIRALAEQLLDANTGPWLGQIKNLKRFNHDRAVAILRILDDADWQYDQQRLVADPSPARQAATAVPIPDAEVTACRPPSSQSPTTSPAALGVATTTATAPVTAPSERWARGQSSPGDA